jgi:hypothetical protein
VTGEQLDRLAPWPLEQAMPYQSDYLAGYQTLRYDTEPEAAPSARRPPAFGARTGVVRNWMPSAVKTSSTSRQPFPFLLLA